MPIAVFLGMNLLFTDPATSPRTLMGRIFYGVAYGLSSKGVARWLDDGRPEDVVAALKRAADTAQNSLACRTTRC